MNNYWYTNYKASQGGQQVFRFSLTSARGGFSKRDAVERGWEMFCPPVAQSGGGPLKPVLSAPAKSLLGVEPAGLPLLAFKQAEDEDGFVLRLCDFAGASGELKLTLPKPARETFTCDLVETHPVNQDSHGRNDHRPAQAICALHGQGAIQVSQGAGWGVQVGPAQRGPSGVQSSLSMHIQRTFMAGSHA